MLLWWSSRVVCKHARLSLCGFYRTKFTCRLCQPLWHECTSQGWNRSMEPLFKTHVTSLWLYLLEERGDEWWTNLSLCNTCRCEATRSTTPPLLLKLWQVSPLSARSRWPPGARTVSILLGSHLNSANSWSHNMKVSMCRSLGCHLLKVQGWQQVVIVTIHIESFQFFINYTFSRTYSSCSDSGLDQHTAN